MPQEMQALCETAFTFSSTLPRAKVYPAVMSCMADAAPEQQPMFINFLTQKVLPDCKNTDSKWPKEIAETLHSMLEDGNENKIQLLHSTSKIAKTMQDNGQQYPRIRKLAIELLNTAMDAKPDAKDALYKSAFSFLDELPRKNSLPVLMEYFRNEKPEEKARYVDTIVNKVAEVCTTDSKWPKDVSDSIIAQIPVVDLQSKGKLADALMSVSMGFSKVAGHQDLALEKFDSLLNLAHNTEDDAAAKVLYAKGTEFFDALVKSDAFDAAQGTGLAKSIVCSLNADNAAQGQQFTLLSHLLENKEMLAIDKQELAEPVKQICLEYGECLFQAGSDTDPEMVSQVISYSGLIHTVAHVLK